MMKLAIIIVAILGYYLSMKEKLSSLRYWAVFCYFALIYVSLVVII